MRLEFSGSRALILGGSCDLAVCLAEAMIKLNLLPILTYRDENGHKRISNHLSSFAGKYETVYLDFADIASLDALFCKIKDDLDFMVDFAQGDIEGLIASVNEEDISRYFERNISFRAKILKKTGRAMLKKKRGRLVFISSSAAGKPNPGQGFYAAAKLASEALYKNLGLELGSRGITTVTLRPGYIDTGRGKVYMRGRQKEVFRLVPTRKAITAKQVTETVLFFLSKSAAGFNAVEIAMDGGLTAGKCLK